MFIEEEIQRTGFRWIDNFFEICPDEMLQFVPRLLALVLPAISHDTEPVRDAAHRVNASLLDLILSLPTEASRNLESNSSSTTRLPSQAAPDKRESSAVRSSTPSMQTISIPVPAPTKDEERDVVEDATTSFAAPAPELDYAATVNALTLQFLNEHEETRVVALDWLIMLHKKAHRKVCMSYLVYDPG